MERVARLNALLARIAHGVREAYTALCTHLAARSLRRRRPVDGPEALRRFLHTRASHVAQISLFGYLRTRAGTRFPELFSDEAFAVSINIAKWQLWLACLSDLGVYAGALIRQRASVGDGALRALMVDTIDTMLSETGVPDDAGPQFRDSADQVLTRIREVDWTSIDDDESAFTESPAALVRWAPIVDELKQLDEEIVVNSVRFRWHEVRRDLRATLDADALVAAHASGGT